jgi:hypothetical protein
MWIGASWLEDGIRSGTEGPSTKTTWRSYAIASDGMQIWTLDGSISRFFEDSAHWRTSECFRSARRPNAEERDADNDEDDHESYRLICSAIKITDAAQEEKISGHLGLFRRVVTGNDAPIETETNIGS